jgi:hypothetical protein
LDNLAPNKFGVRGCPDNEDDVAREGVDVGELVAGAGKGDLLPVRHAALHHHAEIVRAVDHLDVTNVIREEDEIMEGKEREGKEKRKISIAETGC